MSIEYRDLLKASSGSEEVSMRLWTPQSSSRPLYALCMVCAALFCIIIALIISFRTTGSKPLDRTTEFQIGNLSESMKMKVGQLSQDGTKLMEKFQQVDTALKGLQVDPAIGKLQSDVQRVLAAVNRLSNQIKRLSNGSDDVICPSGWSKNQLSCYLYSNEEKKTWEDSKKTCEAKKSHLVVINTEEEQNFIFGITKGKYTWIGLTDVSGEWIWVDGTKYDSTPHNWVPGQPDEYFGHGLGGGEDCAHLHNNGQWNDDHCSRRYWFMCEMNM
ncbi:asialoglycoprotein receptor 1-like [Hyla sarda]|uniref:asialoglycoprotein receptor 1-like n=1 Tax=Hyla sarda TaxID=327740 RepID=UPI0024C3ED83|nr:asialoglycoprotein receptor 1-like [Hyla sarda]XP_056409204.1 asialoglycoprotein receptor 1-like [Hyla sarda]